MSTDIFSQVESGVFSIEEAITELTYEVSSTALENDVWSFAKQNTDDLLTRLKKESISLSEYSKGLICRGVVSGLTEAFVIDGKKRKEILKENPKAENIIKPFLNGRYIRRYALES